MTLWLSPHARAAWGVPPSGNLAGKHQWLFLHPMDSVATVRRLVAFDVGQHNAVIPHAAFRGLTPDEMNVGTAASDASDLPSRLAAARAARLLVNRNRVLSGVSRSPGFRGPARPGASRWGRVARTRAKSYLMSLQRARA